MDLQICRRLIALLFLAATLVIGCGGDDNDATEGEQTTDDPIATDDDDALAALCDVRPWLMGCPPQPWEAIQFPRDALGRIEGNSFAIDVFETEFAVDFEEFEEGVVETGTPSAFDTCIDRNDEAEFCLPAANLRVPISAQRFLSCIPTEPAGLVAAASGSTTLQNFVTASEIVTSDDPEETGAGVAVNRLITIGKQCDFLNEFRAELSKYLQRDKNGSGPTANDLGDYLNGLGDDPDFSRIWADDVDNVALTETIASLQESRHVADAVTASCPRIRLPKIKLVLGCP